MFFFQRMKEALKAFALIHVDMEPGDALFFHCNLLHRSDQNHSNQRRWAMITSFNQRRNNPGNNCILLGFEILLHFISDINIKLKIKSSKS